jgi:signal transduction histidine kinase
MVPGGVTGGDSPPRGTRSRSGRRPLGGLWWRLALSYALVTIVAAVVMSAATAAAQVARGVSDVNQAGVQAILDKSAGAAAPYLGTAADAYTVRTMVAAPLLADLAQQRGSRPLGVAALNTAGQVLAAESCPPAQHTNTSTVDCDAVARQRVQEVLADPDAGAAIRAAAQPGGQPATGTVAGHGYAVVPVPGAKQPTGALLAIFDGPVPRAPAHNSFTEFLTAWRNSWSPSWPPLIILVIVLGTAAGLMLSAGLVRRLRAMAAAAHQWSLGDLTATVAVRGRDEVADLAGDLNSMAEQIRNLLAARREIAMRQERLRVQRDLHDGVKQELFAAAMHLAAAHAALDDGGQAGDPAGRAAGSCAALPHVQRAQASTQRAQRELSAIIDELRPAPMADGGLMAALDQVCVQFEAQTAIPVRRELDAAVVLPEPVAEAAVRIAREALTNVGRHAGASAVRVTLAVDGDTARLVVSDDGQGLPHARGGEGEVLPGELVGTGLGITSMRERAAHAGGTLRIHSAGLGTTVELLLPLDQPGGDRHDADGPGNG